MAVTNGIPQGTTQLPGGVTIAKNTDGTANLSIANSKLENLEVHSFISDPETKEYAVTLNDYNANRGYTFVIDSGGKTGRVSVEDLKTGNIVTNIDLGKPIAPGTFSQPIKNVSIDAETGTMTTMNANGSSDIRTMFGTTHIDAPAQASAKAATPAVTAPTTDMEVLNLETGITTTYHMPASETAKAPVTPATTDPAAFAALDFTQGQAAPTASAKPSVFTGQVKVQPVAYRSGHATSGHRSGLRAAHQGGNDTGGRHEIGKDLVAIETKEGGFGFFHVDHDPKTGESLRNVEGQQVGGFSHDAGMHLLAEAHRDTAKFLAEMKDGKYPYGYQAPHSSVKVNSTPVGHQAAETHKPAVTPAVAKPAAHQSDRFHDAAHRPRQPSATV